ncbi:prepilin peptidase [Pacificimonas sp. WHA3]|uniref:Prepilin peptidase n=1 Tax=Pacificimonas pallii TaxID=2827236 RepID=A0ABS6SA40_9SPHN|nr:prepilin peptidase [Pacificimonas pallii]MBV7255248.1 prepilin peptidase [Pacificimonas pallii]
MQDFFYWISLAALMALLGWTVISDIRSRRIPNWLTLAVAGLAIVFWAAQPVPFPDMMGMQLLLAIAVAVIFFPFWWLGWMGGGDWKLQAALALWLPLAPLLEMFVWIAVVGFFVTLIAWGVHRRQRAKGPVRTPYGVAIAIGAAIVTGEPIINQFLA